MKFLISTTTAGTRVGELASELRHILYPKIEMNYSNIPINIGIVIRTLPDFLNKKSFTRYLSNGNDLTIDFCISLEEYKKLYKVEQKFELGKTFLEWLDKGLSNRNFLKNNSSFNKDSFIDDVKTWGKEVGWFVDEVDYSQELEF